MTAMTDLHQKAYEAVGCTSNSPSHAITRKIVDKVIEVVSVEMTVKSMVTEVVNSLFQARYEKICRVQGWTHGGDGDGIIFHKPTWHSWKAAVSWSGTSSEPDGPDDKPAIYSTWQECFEKEIKP